MHIAFLINLLIFVSTINAFPLWKRLYRPSSPVFSVIAHHEGKVFQYHLLKWDGTDLVLNTDEQAFFGRVRASEGYILNLPGSNKTANSTQGLADTTNVYVDPKTYKLSTTKSPLNSTTGFGIDAQKLTYKNSTEFLACPGNSYRGEYYVYWGNNNKTVCPNDARGYTIDLIVQTDATINYNPETNNRNLTIPPISNKRKRFFFL
ncbi:CIC11C00000005236 [Sungouiella intermedia]|uniref:CIC11C00000005236 n=1 Tax=Sungouiella intermedia TaxID=45354 RepID=A0A1L0C0X9_9ASCO|nr:CIC11C00000005236 [[Candida] intermedia]